jgi:site-specific DNA-methyltransferase (adenine-specific)
MIQLIQGDCLTEMQKIESGSVDAIITDPPYGTTACKWDSVIDFDLMWEQLNRIIKPNGAIVLFGSEPFSSLLRVSNLKNYKYDWIWDKERGVGMSTVKHRPMKQHEIISVFSNNRHEYYPIKIPREKILDSSKWKFNKINSENGNFNSKGKPGRVYKDKFPTSILSYHKDKKECNGLNRVHPTQKPVELMEYLIKTYTNENETVLDFTMGSGSTGVAAKNLNRSFIGIEQDQNYFKIAEERINKPDLFTLDTK